MTDIERLIEASSLGTPDAVAMRERTSPEHARRIVARSKEIAADQIPATLSELADRDRFVWNRDDEQPDLWWAAFNEDYALPLASLIEQHGPLAAVVHERHDPPGPAPSPIPGVCGVCGNTGVVHGPGQNGNWTGEPCGCDTPYCAGCGEPWPCHGAHGGPCCDSHTIHCESPSELCCSRCTEASHDTFPIRHADGARCVLDGEGDGG
jgi:hypothetical protein